MPNLTGGKNYKKTKHHSEKSKYVEKQEDQLYARVIKILGSKNVLTFCNDNIIRLCHIRGSIKKDMWINMGDIILISIRDFLKEKEDKYEKGDILHKYDREDYSKLKKDTAINLRLFHCLENIPVTELKKLAFSKDTNETFLINNSIENTDDIFEYEDTNNEQDNVDKRDKVKKRVDKENDMDVDIDIDAI